MYSRLEMQLSARGTSKHTFADIGLETKYVLRSNFPTNSIDIMITIASYFQHITTNIAQERQCIS